MAREQVRLRSMRIAREDEGLNAHIAIGVEFGEHLIGIADDRRAAAGARAADAGPQIGFGIAVIGGVLAQRRLGGDAGRGRIERFGADRRARGGIELRQQAIGRRARLGFGLANDHMGAVAEAQRAAMLVGAALHVGDDRGDIFLPVGPHQEDVAALRRRFARILAQAAEIQQRRLARERADARRIDLQLPEFAVMVERLAVQQRLQDMHRLDRAGVTRCGGQVSRPACRTR